MEENTPTSLSTVSHAVETAGQHDNSVMTGIIRPVPSIARAKKLGKGNISEGIRIALSRI